MTFSTHFIFSKAAEIALNGETGIGRIDLPIGQTVNVGDELALLLSPSRAVQRFVCTERLWDFSQAGAPRLELMLDLAE